MLPVALHARQHGLANVTQHQPNMKSLALLGANMFIWLSGVAAIGKWGSAFISVGWVQGKWVRDEKAA